MKKIFIYAYTQMNLGDDLFVKILCERYPQHQFYIVCRKSKAIVFLEIPNLTVIYSIPYLDSILYRLSLQHIVINRIVNNCDMVVNIGGSIFIEPRKWEKHVRTYQQRIKVNKPFYILGSNFGPYTSESFHREYKKIFEEVEDICFRDEYSYSLFSDVKGARLAPDVVYTLDVDHIEKKDKSDTIVISVIDLNNRDKLKKYKKNYEEKLAEVSTLLINKGYKVMLMSFCEQEGDVEAAKRVKMIIPKHLNSEVNIYEYKGNMNEALSIIESSNGIIATRFHSMILAWLFKLPMYPLIYSSKTKNVLDDTTFQGESTWIQEIKTVEASKIVSQILNGNNHEVENEIQNAHKQFLKLDEILN